jgi:hypothetical protein
LIRLLLDRLLLLLWHLLTWHLLLGHSEAFLLRAIHLALPSTLRLLLAHQILHHLHHAGHLLLHLLHHHWVLLSLRIHAHLLHLLLELVHLLHLHHLHLLSALLTLTTSALTELRLSIAWVWSTVHLAHKFGERVAFCRLGLLLLLGLREASRCEANRLLLSLLLLSWLSARLVQIGNA